MVTSRGPSRPVNLAQRQVDDIVRGNHEELTTLLRAHAAPDQEDQRRGSESGSRPVDVSAKDIEAIRRSGALPSRLARKIAEATPPEEGARRTRKAKVAAGAKGGATAPTAKPPPLGKSDD
ncbi:MAG TPA: hypothetical protein VGA51_12375 [Casimicrobiaceae bacterium]